MKIRRFQNSFFFSSLMCLLIVLPVDSRGETISDGDFYSEMREKVIKNNADDIKQIFERYGYYHHNCFQVSKDEKSRQSYASMISQEEYMHTTFASCLCVFTNLDYMVKSHEEINHDAVALDIMKIMDQSGHKYKNIEELSYKWLLPTFYLASNVCRPNCRFDDTAEFKCTVTFLKMKSELFK